MEILYTEITQDLTEGLLEIALEELEKIGKFTTLCLLQCHLRRRKKY